MNLNNALEQVVSEQGEKQAMVHSGGEVSYAMFHEGVRRLARGLQELGVGRGDRVAVMLPNLPQFPIVFYATLRLGGVVVPVNMLYRGYEVASLLEDSECRVLVAWQGAWDAVRRMVPALRSLKQVVLLGDDIPDGALNLTRLIAGSKPLSDIEDLDGDDPAVVQYSSSVSGAPRGAELTHGNILSNVNGSREMMQTTPEDTLICALPFFHPLGQTLLMHMGLLTGATLELHPRLDAAELATSFRTGSGSLFVGVPSLFNLLFEASGDDEEPPENPVRLSICSGRIDEDLLKGIEKRFGTYILECYAASETSPVISFNQWRSGRRVGSLGHPLPGVEMKVVNERGEDASIGEVGEIIVKGVNVMRGYINRPKLTAEVLRDGWFHTGDLGKMDINGFFYLVDRMEDRIVKAGFSVYPTEIERVLTCHPDVSEAAVVGVPADSIGEDLRACVVLREGAEATTEQLAEYCRERLAAYKVPTVIRFYKDLPKTSTGRIDRRELRGRSGD